MTGDCAGGLVLEFSSTDTTIVPVYHSMQGQKDNCTRCYVVVIPAKGFDSKSGALQSRRCYHKDHLTARWAVPLLMPDLELVKTRLGHGDNLISIVG